MVDYWEGKMRLINIHLDGGKSHLRWVYIDVEALSTRSGRVWSNDLCSIGTIQKCIGTVETSHDYW